MAYNSDSPVPSFPVHNWRRYKGDLKFHALQKHKDERWLAGSISKPRSRKEGKKLVCPYAGCRSGFDWKQNLNRHIKAVHGGPLS